MKLVVLDADALIHRAYHALPPLSTQRGEPTNAIYGFFSIFIKMVQILQPDYLVAAFDTPAPTFRDKMFEAYKAHRPKTPDELISQLKKIKEILNELGIYTLAKDGYEADDIIGTIVSRLATNDKRLKTEDLEIIIVTGDLDTLQLVREGVKVYTMRKGMSDVVIYDEKAVEDRFGLKPGQLADYKGLVGDASDNIPGVHGVGPKTASELLQKFETLEKIFKSKDLPPKLKGKRDQALFSKELATINKKVPISVEIGKAKWQGFDIPKIEPIFFQLGFSSLLRRIAQTPLQSLSEKQHSLFNREEPKPSNEQEKRLAQVAVWLLNPELKQPEPTESLAALKEKLRKQDLLNIFETIEAPLIPILDAIERTGIKADKRSLEILQVQLQKEARQIRQELFRTAGKEFNPSSPDQLREILFKKFNLSPAGIKKTPKGKISTKESELVKLADKHEIIALILKNRELEKLLSTYISPLFDKIGQGGRVHTTFVQTGTATGRLASQNPNLQNIPVQSEWASKVKNVFVAEHGYLLASFDYSQIELRVAAHLSGDKNLIEAFQNGEDIHTHAASQVFSVQEKAVTAHMRRMAKVFNFGILYGLSAHGLAENLRVSREEAQDFIDNYFTRFSGVKRYIEKTRQEVVKKGYIRTLLGRKRWFEELTHPERLPHNVREAMFREATNFPIQGSATADIIKLAMIKVYPLCSDEVRLILQIHDDLLFEIKRERIKEIAAKIREIMENVVQLDVPLAVEVKVGEKWGELKKIKNQKSNIKNYGTLRVPQNLQSL
ncbi:MAG: hypothetical protein HY001_00185 [Candidatus Portnoybacteria bacterium]|nr:hypothetical protein [Candidatus Portnoybacteria bacterium]